MAETTETKTTEIRCAVCGGEVESKDPDRYPYCRVCHYTGRAEGHLRQEQIARFRGLVPDADEIVVEHTGGGCFWLAFRFGDCYYAATDGEASLPSVDDEPLAEGGWGIVLRYEDDDDCEGTLVIQPDTINPLDYGAGVADRYWNEYPAHCLSDEQIADAIRSDREQRQAEKGVEK